MSTAKTKTHVGKNKKQEPYDGLKGEALTLARELEGQILRIPDLTKVFFGWPIGVNKHLEGLKRLVDEILERVIPDRRKLKALKAANFAYLIALWYPEAEWSELEVATAYSIWIFVWDDEVDAGNTDISNDEEAAREYYRHSLQFVRRQLDVEPTESLDVDVEAPHPNLALFEDVGRGVRDAMDSTQRQRFYRELEHFMVQVGVEHVYDLVGSIPELETFMEIRGGSVGCAPQIALTEYMLRLRLPEALMNSKSMKYLWKETVTICLILNDIYSVRKEMEQGSLFNIVPVLFKGMNEETRNLDKVTDEVMKLLCESVERFEAAVCAIRRATSKDEQAQADAELYHKWCRHFITGVLVWTLESPRYGMVGCVNDDGTVSIEL